MAAGIETVLLAMLAAALYAGTQYVKKWPTEDPEKFDRTKFLSTVFIGMIIGFVAASKGIEPTPETIELQLALYSGTTVIMENILKIGWRIFNKKILPWLAEGEN